MIKYYDRNSKSYKTEKVAGNKALEWTYSTPIGKSFLELLIKKKLFSSVYGSFCDTEYSSKNIDKFIRDLDIDMERYKKQFSFQFGSFNDFFVRELKDEYLNFNMDPKSLISPCDGKLLAYENIDIDSLVQVKGFTYTLKELIGNADLSKEYAEGTCLIFRLCPTDYHRFHFIDNGTCTKSTFINGNYYSVNPIALDKVNKLYCSNKREWSILNSENFKEVLYIEVGATCVGTIVQTYTPKTEVKRGEEKGYFKFGGSTVILFIKKDTVKIAEDIIIHTNEGFETAVNLGDVIGSKI